MLFTSMTVVGWSTLSIAFLFANVDGWVVPVVPGQGLRVFATSTPPKRVASFKYLTRSKLTATTEQEEQQERKDEEEKKPQQEQRLYDVLDGVSDFEDWFQSLDRASCDSSIRHAAFGSLRGLKQQVDSPLDGRVVDVVATVPKTAVLSSSYADKDWDSQLAILLWKECIKGTRSDIYG
jgi:predicted ATP-binding protein involved in virulence